MYVALALTATGRAFVDSDPARALDAFRQALTVAQEQRMAFWEARVPREAANLETTHGDVDRGLELFDTAIDAYHRAGNIADLSAVLAELAVFFNRDEQPETAATVYGASSHYPNENWVIGLPVALDNLPRRTRATPSSASASPPGRRWTSATPYGIRARPDPSRPLGARAVVAGNRVPDLGHDGLQAAAMDRWQE